MASLELLAEAQDFDSLHSQEMSPPGVTGDDAGGRVQEWRGHIILCAESTAAALVIHRRWTSRIRGTCTSKRISGAALESDDESIFVIILLHRPTP